MLQSSNLLILGCLFFLRCVISVIASIMVASPTIKDTKLKDENLVFARGRRMR
jgi:hypothetical protein